MTDDQILEVVSAHKEGKKIECRGKSFRPVIPKWNEWTFSNPHWNFAEFDYRVAPEPRKPREWNAWYKPDCGGLTDAWMERYRSQGWLPIKVREVIE